MKKILPLIGLLMSLSFAQAQGYIANLDAAQDGGGARTGSGMINLTLSETMFTFTGSFSGLSGTVNNGGFHIHGPAAEGVNAGVLYGIFSSITLAEDRKSGTINGSGTLVANPNNTTYDIPTQISQLNNGLWYFNIHSSTFAGGEIRGQILPVPEPSTVVLGGLGLGGLLRWRIRRRAA